MMFSGGREVMHWEKTGYCNVKWRAELSWIQFVFFYWDSDMLAAYNKGLSFEMNGISILIFEERKSK